VSRGAPRQGELVNGAAAGDVLGSCKDIQLRLEIEFGQFFRTRRIEGGKSSPSYGAARTLCLVSEPYLNARGLDVKMSNSSQQQLSEGMAFKKAVYKEAVVAV
jgi:hypothetical protein